MQPRHTERIQRREIKPPTFDGGKEVRRFLEMFDAVKKNNRWTDEQAAVNLRLALEDSVAEGVQELAYEEAKTKTIYSITGFYHITLKRNDVNSDLHRRRMM